MNKMPSAGEKAPLFELRDASESIVNLESFKGKWIVIYFYPKDNTPGCTIEAISFSALKDEFKKLNTVVLGISKDSCQSHVKFIEKQNLTINLLSDPNSEMMKSYGVWRPKKFMGREFLGTVRSTFLIDPKGILRKAWDNVSANGHAEEVLESLKAM